MPGDVQTTRGELAEPKRFGELLRTSAKRHLESDELAEFETCFKRMPDLWKKVSLSLATARMVTDTQAVTKSLRVIQQANREGMKRELGDQQAPPLERLLIDHLALCWVRLQHVEQEYSWAVSKGMNVSLARFWEQRLSASQGRFLRACATLARIRRLAVPAAKQVNIAAAGGQQMNVVAEAKGNDSKDVL